jgi:hypothetical protein
MPIKNKAAALQTWKRFQVGPLNSVMAGCVGLPLKRQAGPWSGTSNPIQSVTRRFEAKGGGSSIYQGVPAMRNHAFIPAIQAPVVSPVLTLIKPTHSPSIGLSKVYSPWGFYPATRSLCLFKNASQLPFKMKAGETQGNRA